MSESLVRVPNLCWDEAQLNPVTDLPAAIARGLTKVSGRFAVVHEDENGLLLGRDKLGLNKLFLASHPTCGFVIANYLADLLDTDIPFEAIRAVPPGSTVHVTPTGSTTTQRFYRLPHPSNCTSPASVIARATQELAGVFQNLAAEFADARVVICLSGGLDSSLIAALATQYFTDVTAYTYMYTGKARHLSQDAIAADQLATTLGLRFRLVTADEEKIFGALPGALRNGQDWRDFNVHCAIVNELLAEAIASDAASAGKGRRVLVLTGDLMNEIVADYAPVTYRGAAYYPLPDLPPAGLRTALLRGMQIGDREIGVFSSRGLIVAQPYAHIFETLLFLPDSYNKSDLIHALAGELLPARSYQRTKVRAQIGSPNAQEGILPLFVDSGRDSRWLRSAFCDELGIKPDALRAATRAGVHRPPNNPWS